MVRFRGCFRYLRHSRCSCILRRAFRRPPRLTSTRLPCPRPLLFRSRHRPVQHAGTAQSARVDALQGGGRSNGVQRQRTVGSPHLSVSLPAAPMPGPVARSASAALSVDARSVPVSRWMNAGAVPTFPATKAGVLGARMGIKIPRPVPRWVSDCPISWGPHDRYAILDQSRHLPVED